MKKYLFFFVFLSFLSHLANAQKKEKILAIGFYNVENFFHPENDTAKLDEDFTPTGAYHYSNEVYLQKLHNIATVFKQLGTDVTPDGAAIIGIAEIENDKVLNDLVQQLEIRNRKYQWVWHPTADVRGISTALFYNPKYFQLLSSKPFHVPLELVGQKRPTRDVLYVKGILTGNDTVHIMVNHWPSRAGNQETDTLRKIAAAVDKHIVDSLLALNPNTKILIMGDLNDNPTDASITKVLQAKADTFSTTLSGIYNPWIKLYKNGVGTEIYNGRWNLFDQIMLSGSFLKNQNGKWKYQNNIIFRKEFLTQLSGDEQSLPHRSFNSNKKWDNGYSDHFPVIIYLGQ